MILRQARLEDFEVFKKLFEDKEGLYQFLYNSSNEDTTIPSECQWTFDDSIFELYENYPLEQFQKDLKSSLLIYMIEDSSEVIGYISMFYCDSYKYKIAEWAMFNPENEQKKIEVLNCLKELKIPQLRKFSICTLSEDVGKFLLSNGFSYSKCFFYELKI